MLGRVTLQLGRISRHRPQKSQLLASPAVSGRQRLVLGRFKTTNSAVDDPGVVTFLSSSGIDQRLHTGVIAALKSAYGRPPTLADVQSFGEGGLVALAQSVEEQERRRAGHRKRPSTTVHFTIPHHGTEFDLEWKLGDSLLDVAQSPAGVELLSEYMEGACGGQMSCCTCHVYLDETTYALLTPGEPEEAEQDMLDLAHEPRDRSRLGCQVVLTEELIATGHKPTVTIPSGVNNMWI